MKTKIIICILSFLFSSYLYPRVKEVIVTNESNKPIKVAIHISPEPNSLGDALFKSKKILKDSTVSFDRRYTIDEYINVVWYRDDGEKIVLESKRNDRKLDRKFQFNVSETNLTSVSIDNVDLQHMNSFLDNEVQNFKDQHAFAVRNFDYAESSIPEYLGSIIIADTSSGIAEKNRTKYQITARQLGINQEFEYKGSDRTNTYRFSKEFESSGDANFPGLFSVSLHFENADLIEAKYSISKLGTVLFKSEENVSAFDLLDNFENNSEAEVYSSIAEILKDCPQCGIFQVNRVLAFKNVKVTTRNYKKQKFGTSIGVQSILTANGSYKTEEAFSYAQNIDSRVISLGSSSTSLSTVLIKSIQAKLSSQINEDKAILGRRSSEINKIKERISTFEGTLKVFNDLTKKDAN